MSRDHTAGEFEHRPFGGLAGLLPTGGQGGTEAVVPEQSPQWPAPAVEVERVVQEKRARRIADALLSGAHLWEYARVSRCPSCRWVGSAALAAELHRGCQGELREVDMVIVDREPAF